MENTMILNNIQEKLVSDHMDLVKWVISKYIIVNETIVGLSFEDLFQEGCILLCKAAACYDNKSSKFITFATVIIRNGLFSYCKKTCNKYYKCVNIDDVFANAEKQKNENFIFPDFSNNLISDISISNLLESVKPRYDGIARLGIEALELKIKGYSGAEIAMMWGKKQNHIGAWISRAKEKLVHDELFMASIKDKMVD